MKSSGSGKSLNYFKILSGVFNAFILTLVLFLAIGGILYYTKISEDMIPKFVVAVSALSIAISGIHATRDIDRYGWLHGGLIGLLYVTILLILGFFLIPSASYGLTTVVDLVMGFTVGMMAGAIGTNL
ncbi:MAG: TIGR04086 family membrane protein [Tepidanaerobacteraceae bacterium]|jgi:putative membrane protein (TIGR04086 family)|nr:TIGR04086 family membrane protein [Tepidanaerobacteraceae bacterium]